METMIPYPRKSPAVETHGARRPLESLEQVQVLHAIVALETKALLNDWLRILQLPLAQEAEDVKIGNPDPESCRREKILHNRWRERCWL